MSAPDVERLVEALTKCAETFERYTKLHLSKKPLTDEAQCKAIANHQMAEMCRNALSSHPDPIPASADITGRLAIATRDLIDAVEKACEWDAETRVGNAIAVVESFLAAYRATPSGPDACPICGSPEVEAETPRTVYACGSSDYDRRDGTFQQGSACNRPKRADGWIPVGERLPEFGLPVWLSEPDRGIWIGGRADDDAEGWLWGNAYNTIWHNGHKWDADLHTDDDYRPTLWQPLPPPPQDEHSGRIYTDPEEIEAAQRQMREGRV